MTIQESTELKPLFIYPFSKGGHFADHTLPPPWTPLPRALGIPPALYESFPFCITQGDLFACLPPWTGLVSFCVLRSWY